MYIILTVTGLKMLTNFLTLVAVIIFFSGNYCFIEWPQIVEDYLPDDCVKIFIEVDDDTQVRTIKTE